MLSLFLQKINFLAQIGRMPIPGGREELPTTIFCQDIVDCIKFFGGLVANVIFIGILIGAVIVLLIGAIMYLIGGSKSDDETLKKAKKVLIYSVVAAVLASLAWVAINAIVTTLTFLPKEVFAANDKDIFTLSNYKITTTDVESLFATSITSILNYIYWAALILALIMILIAAINYITSRGQENKIKDATNALKYAIIGVVVALISWVIIKLIMMLFGVNAYLFNIVFAQQNTINQNTVDVTSTIKQIFGRAEDVARTIGYALAILMAIIIGIIYITSRGGEGVKTANKAIIYLAVGIAIILLAGIVVDIVKFILLK
jgi:hypothetical protein